MHEPGGYREANDALIAAAEASEGRFVVSAASTRAPRTRPRRPSARSMRARRGSSCTRALSGSRCTTRSPRRSSRSPTSVACRSSRTGRGIPALGRDAVTLAERHSHAPIILAHAGISDLAWLWSRGRRAAQPAVRHPWWSAADLLALLSLVPPGQVLYASDAPYGTPLQAAVVTVRCALQAGVTREQLAAVMGGQTDRLLAGEAPLDVGPRPARTGLRPTCCSTAFTPSSAAPSAGSWRAATARSRSRSPGSRDVLDALQYEVCRTILGLLDSHRAYVAEHTVPDGAPRFPGMHLLVVASVLARTPDVPVPAE